MADNRAAPGTAAPATYAKGALRRLAMAQLEPTPDNYARAYAEEAGVAAPHLPDAAQSVLRALAELVLDDAAAREALANAVAAGQWARARELVEQARAARQDLALSTAETLRRMVQCLDRPTQNWPAGRQRESLQRVLANSRSDLQRLQQRLSALVAAWETDSPAAVGLEVAATAPAAVLADGGTTTAWPTLANEFNSTVIAALPPKDSTARALADTLARLGPRVAAEGAHAALVAEVQAACAQARSLFEHRHRLVEELATLCRELGAGMTELAEDPSWARGQGEQLQARLAESVSLRSVRAASAALAQARQGQQAVRGQRDEAREALKAMIQVMLKELDTLGAQTDSFHHALGQHAQAVQSASTLESLADVVREMVERSRDVQQLVGSTRERLHSEHTRAAELQERVAKLEDALRKASDDATTDALTQVANRRGLTLAFDGEVARMARAGAASPGLSLALIDIDNFKKLNDTLGHAAGDEALRSLAAAVRERLRPGDHFARFGGEEFVAGHRCGRSQRGLDALAAQPQRKPLHARGPGGLRDLLFRRHGMARRRDAGSCPGARGPGALRSQAHWQEPHVPGLTPRGLKFARVVAEKA
jgi:diguanylate cyclase